MNASYNGGAPPAIFLDPSIDWASINSVTWPIWVLTLIALVTLLYVGYLAVRHVALPLFRSVRNFVRSMRTESAPR